MTADDFAAIRARMEELRREQPAEPEDHLRARVRRVPIEEIARATQLRLRRVLGSPAPAVTRRSDPR
jgi:hypothetical protein